MKNGRRRLKSTVHTISYPLSLMIKLCANWGRILTLRRASPLYWFPLGTPDSSLVVKFRIRADFCGISGSAWRCWHPVHRSSPLWWAGNNALLAFEWPPGSFSWTCGQVREIDELAILPCWTHMSGHLAVSHEVLEKTLTKSNKLLYYCKKKIHSAKRKHIILIQYGTSY
jgi:hypothetical protein